MKTVFLPLMLVSVLHETFTYSKRVTCYHLPCIPMYSYSSFWWRLKISFFILTDCFANGRSFTKNKTKQKEWFSNKSIIIISFFFSYSFLFKMNSYPIKIKYLWKLSKIIYYATWISFLFFFFLSLVSFKWWWIDPEHLFLYYFIYGKWFEFCDNTNVHHSFKQYCVY